jgi:predicted phosphohydrolase
MKIQYCSDLHLEFPVNKKYLKANPIKPEGEILLLAGDIMLLTDIDKEKEFFDFLSDSFARSYWVPGNHEYYRSDISQRTGSFYESIRSNVTLLNNTAIVYKDVRLLFSTLWSKIDVKREQVIKKSMADFRLIKSNGRIINVDDYNLLHADALSFIKGEI